MKQKSLYQLCLFWFIVSMISACGQHIKEDKHVFESNPDTVDKVANNYLRLGLEYMRLQKNDVALGHLKKALELDYNYADAHSVIAILYERVGVDDKAQQHYQTAINIKPNSSYIHNNYGQFLCNRNQWQEADAHFLKALKNPVYRTPEIPYTNAGMCALRSKNINKAEKYLRTALQKNPKFSLALYQMANLSYKQKHYMQARAYLQRYIQLSKHTPQTLWLGIRIERILNNRNTEAEYILLLRKNFPDASEVQLLNRR